MNKSILETIIQSFLILLLVLCVYRFTLLYFHWKEFSVCVSYFEKTRKQNTELRKATEPLLEVMEKKLPQNPLEKIILDWKTIDSLDSIQRISIQKEHIQIDSVTPLSDNFFPESFQKNYSIKIQEKGKRILLCPK